MANPIAAALAEHEQRAEQYQAAEGVIPEPPEQPGPKRRGLKRQQAAIEVPSDYVELDQVEGLIMDAAMDYITGNHSHVLLLAVPPGAGKTRAGVSLAEQLAAGAQRVLYLGPQHRFFADVQSLARRPEWWQEWLPHQEGNETTPSTCRHAGAMERWVQRGYQGIDFCKNGKICGWDYISNTCPWHAQSRQQSRIVFAQHAHLFGIPDLENFDLIIGDENPMAAVAGGLGPGGNWTIPNRYIAPPDMDLTEPFTELVHRLATLASNQTRAEGPDLLTLLGGAQSVIEACASYSAPISQRSMQGPNIRNAGAVEDAPYGHVLALGHLLWKEAEAHLTGQSYPHRVYVANEKLHLLMRRYTHADTHSKPVIWLDATASTRIYEAVFTPRPVRIVTANVRHQGKVYQVWQRANGKSSLVKGEEPTDRADQTKTIVKHITKKYAYTNPAFVTFKSLQAYFGERTVNFSDVGTNTIQDCDALFVIGTPQPSIFDIEQHARMLFWDRMAAFDVTWSQRDRTYRVKDGCEESYPVSGFWADDDLHAVLWQQREAKLVQALHRARPLRRKVDIWLLSNIPLVDTDNNRIIEPDELLTIADVFQAPAGVDPYRWAEFILLADAAYDEDRPLMAADVALVMGVDPHTARKWLALLAQTSDRWDAPPPDYILPKRGSGRPSVFLVPNKGNDS